MKSISVGEVIGDILIAAGACFLFDRFLSQSVVLIFKIGASIVERLL